MLRDKGNVKGGGLTNLNCEMPPFHLSISTGLKLAEKEVTSLIDKHLGLGPSSSTTPSAPPGPKVTNIPIQMPDTKPDFGPKVTQIPIQRPDKPRPDSGGFGRPSSGRQGELFVLGSRNIEHDR